MPRSMNTGRVLPAPAEKLSEHSNLASDTSVWFFVGTGGMGYGDYCWGLYTLLGTRQTYSMSNFRLPLSPTPSTVVPDCLLGLRQNYL